jgi:XTP/dITP diphosphohydrolase
VPDRQVLAIQVELIPGLRFNPARIIRLLLATRNLHKVGEIRALLGDGFECRCLRDYPDAPEVIEDAATFEGNALKKAQRLATWLREARIGEWGVGCGIDFVLADDSGLEVDALGGAPGVHSARFAALDTGSAGNSKDGDNNAKLLQLLADVPPGQRTARFRCVIALCPIHPSSAVALPRRPGDPLCFDGVCEGCIAFAPRGAHGFGYDPLFQPLGFDHTFAEVGEDIKNRISHRSKALEKLKSVLARTERCGRLSHPANAGTGASRGFRL